MATEKDLELLDDYLANRMPVEERVAFEKRIEADANLKSEITFQNKMVEGLRQARAAELKAMLNTIPVSGIGTSTAVTKALIGIAITALVGTGLYLAFSEQETPEVTERATEVVPQQQEPASIPEKQNKEAEQPVVAEEEEKKQPVTSTEKLVLKKKAKKIEPSLTIDPKIEVFDPTAELESESSEPTENEILSDDDKISTIKATVAVTVDSTSRRHDFHYTMKGDDLTLYGSFERNLYEILEFFSENKRTAFLYYKNAYYHIQETDKITTLAPVQDPALLNKLRKHRTKG